MEVDPETGLAKRPAPKPYPLGPATIAALLDAPLTDTPDQLALIDEDRSWTYAALDEAVEQAAGALIDIGVDAGSRVAWTLPNGADLPIGFLATQRLGAVWLGINEALAGPEKQHLLDDSEATHYIATGAAQTGATGGYTAVNNEEWAGRTAAATRGERARHEIDPHAPAAIAYTSGTTGRPKGAVHSQHNLLWAGLVTLRTDPVTAHERQGTPLALTVLNIMTLGPIAALARGSTGVVLHSTRASDFAADVARFAVTRTLLVPTIAHDLVRDDQVTPAQLASLDSVILGGARTPAATRRAFVDKFGVRAISGYGLSEAPSGIVRESPDDPIDDSATGYPMEPFALSIRDGNGVELPANTEGEICVGPTTHGEWARCWTPMLGYWKQPEATVIALADGVLHTGDIGALDHQGRLSVSGRRSDLILRGGASIYPAEVEAALSSHPHVAEAAVLGAPDDRLGQRVVAFVVATAEAPDLDAVRAWCHERLATYKVPAEINVVDALPRNAMDKVVKSELVTDEPDQ